NNNFRWHRHASADMRAGIHTLAVWDGGFNFLCQPPGHVKFRDDDVLGVLCGFTDFLAWPRPQGLDLDQTTTDAFVLQEPDGFTALRHRCTEETMRISASVFSVSINPFIHLIVCLRDRSTAAQTSCCQDAWVA